MDSAARLHVLNVVLWTVLSIFSNNYYAEFGATKCSVQTNFAVSKQRLLANGHGGHV